MEFIKLPKLKAGDKVAVVSPSFDAPGKWPHVYELGLQRVREVFGLVPVAFPATKKLGASKEERSNDLIEAFQSKEIRAVIASLGGDDQVTYIKDLPQEPFIGNPKPFFGYSDNSHFINHLWLNGIPSFYGGNLFTEFAMQGKMDEFTVKYLKHAFFEEGEFELEASAEFNDIGMNWNDKSLLGQKRIYQSNDGWSWDGNKNTEGITWGGCVESIDEMFRHAVRIPSLEQFNRVIVFMETSEEIPSAEYVMRVFRALGERGILGNIRGLIMGRPKAWEFNKPQSDEEKIDYKKRQGEAVLKIVRQYNQDIPVVQNVDFGHTAPQICIPVGSTMRIDSTNKKIFAGF